MEIGLFCDILRNMKNSDNETREEAYGVYKQFCSSSVQECLQLLIEVIKLNNDVSYFAIINAGNIIRNSGEFLGDSINTNFCYNLLNDFIEISKSPVEEVHKYSFYVIQFLFKVNESLRSNIMDYFFEMISTGAPTDKVNAIHSIADICDTEKNIVTNFDFLPKIYEQICGSDEILIYCIAAFAKLFFQVCSDFPSIIESNFFIPDFINAYISVLEGFNHSDYMQLLLPLCRLMPRSICLVFGEKLEELFIFLWGLYSNKQISTDIRNISISIASDIIAKAPEQTLNFLNEIFDTLIEVINTTDTTDPFDESYEDSTPRTETEQHIDQIIAAFQYIEGFPEFLLEKINKCFEDGYIRTSLVLLKDSPSYVYEDMSYVLGLLEAAAKAALDDADYMIGHMICIILCNIGLCCLDYTRNDPNGILSLACSLISLNDPDAFIALGNIFLSIPKDYINLELLSFLMQTTPEERIDTCMPCLIGCIGKCVSRLEDDLDDSDKEEIITYYKYIIDNASDYGLTTVIITVIEMLSFPEMISADDMTQYFNILLANKDSMGRSEHKEMKSAITKLFTKKNDSSTMAVAEYAIGELQSPPILEDLPMDNEDIPDDYQVIDSINKMVNELSLISYTGYLQGISSLIVFDKEITFPAETLANVLEGALILQSASTDIYCSIDNMLVKTIQAIAAEDEDKAAELIKMVDYPFDVETQSMLSQVFLIAEYFQESSKILNACAKSAQKSTTPILDKELYVANEIRGCILGFCMMKGIECECGNLDAFENNEALIPFVESNYPIYFYHAMIDHSAIQKLCDVVFRFMDSEFLIVRFFAARYASKAIREFASVAPSIVPYLVDRAMECLNIIDNFEEEFLYENDYEFEDYPFALGTVLSAGIDTSPEVASNMDTIFTFVDNFDYSELAGYDRTLLTLIKVVSEHADEIEYRSNVVRSFEKINKNILNDEVRGMVCNYINNEKVSQCISQETYDKIMSSISSTPQ